MRFLFVAEIQIFYKKIISVQFIRLQSVTIVWCSACRSRPSSYDVLRGLSRIWKWGEGKFSIRVDFTHILRAKEKRYRRLLDWISTRLDKTSAPRITTATCIFTKQIIFRQQMSTFTGVQHSEGWRTSASPTLWRRGGWSWTTWQELPWWRHSRRQSWELRSWKKLKTVAF